MAAILPLLAGIGLAAGGPWWLRYEYPAVRLGMEKRDDLAGTKIVKLLFPIVGAVVTLSGLGLVYYYASLFDGGSTTRTGEEDQEASSSNISTAAVVAATSCVASFPSTFMPCLPTMHSGRSPRMLLALFALDVVAICSVFDRNDVLASLPALFATTFALVNVVASSHRTITSLSSRKQEQQGQQQYALYAVSAAGHVVLIALFGRAAIIRLLGAPFPPGLKLQAIAGTLLGAVEGAVDSVAIKRFSRFLYAPIIDFVLLLFCSRQVATTS